VQFLSDFADQQVMLPLGFALAVALAVAGWKRGALAWIGIIVGVLGSLTVLKIVLLACGWRWSHGELNSPSGHTASAALFYGGFALLVLRPGGIARAVLFLAPPALAVVVGFSRIELHNHTVAEVVVGAMLGVAGAFLLPLLAGTPPARLPLRWLLPPAVLVVVLLHGHRLQAESVLHHFTIEGLWPPASCQRPADAPPPD
jgi:membrane-associated phospholipid phosphatase